MFTTYKDALEWIHSRLRLGIKPGLKRMERLLEKLEHPEQQLKVIHVGGTNGKGSTVTYIRSILQEAGYEVGTFTSPYIEQFNERISINGQPIPNQDIITLVNKIKPLAEEMEDTELGPPSEFEVITAMAIYYFAHMKRVDFCIFEVGLGGRFDSTNVLSPLISIITNVGMDHTQFLGDTIEQIAFEKAGIIKKNTPVITTAKNKEALKVLTTKASKEEAPIYQINKDFYITHYEPADDRERFSYQWNDYEFKNLEVSLLGKHQTENASAAVTALLYLHGRGIIDISENAIRTGLQKAYWPGRFEIVQKKPAIILDGSHNVEGFEAFREAITTHYPNQSIHLIFAALKDKDLSGIFRIIKEMDVTLYLTEFDFPRVASVSHLLEMYNDERAIIVRDWKLLIDQVINSVSNEDVVAVTGSLYFISEVKPYILEKIRKMG